MGSLRLYGLKCIGIACLSFIFGLFSSLSVILLSHGKVNLSFDIRFFPLRIEKNFLSRKAGLRRGEFRCFCSVDRRFLGMDAVGRFAAVFRRFVFFCFSSVLPICEAFLSGLPDVEPCQIQRVYHIFVKKSPNKCTKVFRFLSVLLVFLPKWIFSIKNCCVFPLF